MEIALKAMIGGGYQCLLENFFCFFVVAVVVPIEHYIDSLF